MIYCCGCPYINNNDSNIYRQSLENSNTQYPHQKCMDLRGTACNTKSYNGILMNKLACLADTPPLTEYGKLLA